MASKRALKKELIAAASRLYEDGLLFRAFATGAQVEQVDEILDDIMVWTDDTIRRIANPDAKDNPKLVHAYYQALRADMRESYASLDERLINILETL